MPGFEDTLQQAIDSKNFRNLEPESEEDGDLLYKAFCETMLPDVPEDRLEAIKPGFLVDLLEYGLTETNPFVQFIRKILPIVSMTLDQYRAISSLYKDRELEDIDLKGQSIDGFKHIIFNPDLYKEKNVNDFKYLIQVWDWCQETYSILRQLNIKKVIEYYNNFKSVEDRFAFRDDIFYVNMPELIKAILEAKTQINWQSKDPNKNWGMFKKQGSFNSADQIEKNLESLHGSEIKSNRQTNTEEKPQLVNWQKGLNQIVNKNNIGEILYTLLSTYTLDDNRYNSVKTEFPDLPDQLDFKTSQRWRRQFSQLDINQKNIDNVLKYLIGLNKSW